MALKEMKKIQGTRGVTIQSGEEWEQGASSGDRFDRSKGGRRKYKLQVESRFQGATKLITAGIPSLCLRET